MDASGNAVQRMEHDPWGQVSVNDVIGGFERVPFGIAGGLYDADTGLVRLSGGGAGNTQWLSSSCRTCSYGAAGTTRSPRLMTHDSTERFTSA